MTFLAGLLLLAAWEPTTLLTPPFSHTMGFERINSYFIKLYLGADFRIAEPEGMCGAKMTEEDKPGGADDHILTLFAVNSGTGQVVYNVKLIEPHIYGSTGSDTAQFANPHGICCNPAGDVYVADTDNGRVAHLNYTNGRLGWVGVVESGLASPWGIDLDSRGRLYVTESGADRVIVYDEKGNRLPDWTGDLDGPTGIAVLDKDAPYNQYGTDAAVVIDRAGTRVSLFNLSGQLRRQVDLRRLGLTEASFAYVAFDRHGNSYVTDRVNNQLHVFDPDLKYIVSFGGDQTFDSPRGLVIWRRFGQCFITEARGGRYLWVGLDGYLVGMFPEEFDSRRPGTTIALYVTEVADVEVHITDGAKRLVRTLTPPHDQRPGEVLIVWDGLDDEGRLVPEGDYRVEAVIRPTYSTPKRTFKKELTGTVRRVPDR